MWNPWKKAQALADTVSELAAQLQIRCNESKDLAKCVMGLKGDLALLKSQLDRALQQASVAEADARVAKQANQELKVQLAQMKQSAATASDAYSLLGQLAHSRLEKLNQVRSITERQVPCSCILRSFGALRSEADAYAKIVQDIRDVL